jgi:hypothetical protein
MAYMSQEKKAKIAANLKSVVPSNWKYSLAVRHHSTIVFNLKSAPLDLPAIWFRFNADKNPDRAPDHAPSSLQVNTHWLDEHWPADIAKTLSKIAAALNTDNHDRSDSQTDYFDVGHYVDINIGRWNQPFQVSSR